jgi:hypothetical protein
VAGAEIGEWGGDGGHFKPDTRRWGTIDGVMPREREREVGASHPIGGWRPAGSGPRPAGACGVVRRDHAVRSTE